MRRRIGGGGAADGLVARCRDRGITEAVVRDCACADLMEELGVSEEAASALRLDDAAWGASVWPLFARMAEEGLPPRAVAEARAAMAGLPKTLAQLRRCPPQALKDAHVPLTVRVWLRARGYVLLEAGGGHAAAEGAAAGPAHDDACALPPGAAGHGDGSADAAGPADDFATVRPPPPAPHAPAVAPFKLPAAAAGGA